MDLSIFLVTSIMAKKSICDNIEVSRDSFDELTAGKFVISSEGMNSSNDNWDSVKISFSGKYIYKIHEDERNPRVLKVVDMTEHIYGNPFIDCRIDLERKHYGLIADAWKIILMIVIVVLSTLFCLIHTKQI